MQTSKLTSSVKNLADSPETFHIVMPQRSKLANRFDEDVGAKQSLAIACILPPCLAVNS